MKFDTKRITETNSLFDWLERYGINIDKKGFACCPFHNEKTASFRVYKDGTFHCFGCGAHGDVITFVMKMQGITFKEACEMLDRNITYSEQRKIERIKKHASAKKHEREMASKSYWEAFDDWKYNEDMIELFRPASIDEEPNAIFLYALHRRGILEHQLNLCKRSVEKCKV